MSLSFKVTKPTKTNLIKIRKKLNLALKGENFLEYKRQQLFHEISNIWEKYNDLRSRLHEEIENCVKKLTQCYKEMRKTELYHISKMSNLQYDPFINLTFEKRSGISFPILNYNLNTGQMFPPYSFENSSIHLDQLIENLREMFQNLIKLAEVEDLLLKLGYKFKKIDRRINGLKYSIIPDLRMKIKRISSILEEIDRENFIRLKKIKDLLNSQKRERRIELEGL